MNKLTNFMALIAILLSGCTVGLKPVELSESELLRTYFSAEILPPCLVELSPLYEKGVCYQSAEELGIDEYRILHQRFLQNMKKLREEGGEYQNLINGYDQHDIYEEALCTLGFGKSCALCRILEIDSRTPRIDSYGALQLVTGRALRYQDVDEAFYPPNYNPEDYEHFRYILSKVRKYLKEQKAFTEKQLKEERRKRLKAENK